MCTDKNEKENVFAAASIALGKILVGKKGLHEVHGACSRRSQSKALDLSSEQEKLVQKVKMSHEHLWRASGVIAVLVVPGEVTASTAGNPTCGDEGSKMEVMVKTKEVAKAARLVRRPHMEWNTVNGERTQCEAYS